MRISTFLFLCIGLTGVSHTPQASAQAFQNLDFEAATVVPIPDDSFGRIYLSQAIPGWMGFVGANQESAAGFDGTFLCCSQVSLWGGRNHPELPIAGTFSVGLHASRADNGQLADTAIAQSGLVPASAQSLLFKAQGGGPLSVALGGQSLSIVPLSTGPNYTLFGADITGWGGHMSELRFTALATPTFSFVVLDDIVFSSEPIPEPQVILMLVLAAALAAVWSLYCNSRQRRGRPFIADHRCLDPTGEQAR
jgi:hypothetical protein